MNIYRVLCCGLALIVACALMIDDINFSIIDIHGFKNEFNATYDPLLGFRLKKRTEMKNNIYHGFRYNYDGFVGPEFKKHRPAGVFRIICLGGSTTFGAGVESDKFSYPEILQQIFDKFNVGGSRKIEVINGGVFGYNSLHTMLRVKTQLGFFEPNLYIVMDGLNDLDLVRNLTRKKGLGPSAFKDELDFVGYKSNLQRTIDIAKENGVGTVLVSDPMQEGPGQDSSPFLNKNNDLYELFSFGRSALLQANISLAQENNILFVNEQPVFDRYLIEKKELNRVWSDDLHLTRYGYYLLAREVYRQLMSLPSIQRVAGTSRVASDDEMDAFFPELVLWRPAEGTGWPEAQEVVLNAIATTANISDTKKTEEGWSAFIPKDPATPAILSMQVTSGDNVRFYPRIENVNDRVTVLWLSNGGEKTLFRLEKTFDDGLWTPESAWYKIRIPEGEEGKLEIKLSGNNAQLWHKGSAILFQEKSAR